MTFLLRVLNWGWWIGVVLAVFLVLLSSYWPSLEIVAGILGAFAFSCAIGGAALCLVGDNNG